MVEKGSVGEIVETGGIIIAHAVFESGNEVVAWDVMMLMALMERLGSGRQGLP
jgi:hypothetical protein